jgi:hypothetical protein
MLSVPHSYHGCLVAVAGRRIMEKRGRQTLTFPSGLEGLLTIERIPGHLSTPLSRTTLLSRACAHMHALAPAYGRPAYGRREAAGSIKWWCDVAYLASKDMTAAQLQRLLEHLKRTLANSGTPPEDGGTNAGNTGGKDVSGCARDAAGVGLRLPLHLCVRERDELCTALLLLLAAEVDARDPKGRWKF